MAFTKQQQQEAIEDLRERLTPGQDIYVVQRSVSRSGMSRRVDLFYISTRTYGPDLVRFTWSAARALNWPLNDVGLRVDGAGMDMHFHTVYSLGRKLWPDGTGWDTSLPAKRDGGYALNARTL